MSFAKKAANWLLGDITRRLKEEGLTIDQSKLAPESLVQLLFLMEKGIITGKIAKTFIVDMIHGKKPIDILLDRGISVVDDDDELSEVVKGVVERFPDVVKEIEEGREKAVEFLIGQVMRETRGQADPEKTRNLLKFT